MINTIYKREEIELSIFTSSFETAMKTILKDVRSAFLRNRTPLPVKMMEGENHPVFTVLPIFVQFISQELLITL